MSKEIGNTTGGHISPFERIKRTNDAGMEFWSSRDLASGHRLEDHFVDVTEMVDIAPSP